MPSERLHWVHPNALRYGELQKSGRYLHYYRHWERFTLTLRDYRLTRFYALHNTEGRDEDPVFQAAAGKLSNEGWEALTKEEQTAFEESQIKMVRPATISDGVRFEGWGELEGGLAQEEITSVSVDNDPRWRSSGHDDNYNKTFSRLRVSITTSTEEHHGSMFIWGESMRDYNRDGDGMPGEDVLCLQFYMDAEKLKKLALEIDSRATKPVLTINAQALMFHDEVDAALSEVWHPKEYVVIYDHHTPAVLNSISFNLGQETFIATTSEFDDDTIETTPAQTRTTPKAVSSKEGAAAQLKGLKQAIWVLAAAVIVAAVL